MIEKRISANGHIYAKLASLTQWDKNPRDIYENEAQQLKVRIATLGLFKPLFVTADGVMVGGNMRLPALQWLNENVLTWEDSKGTHEVDKRGKFEEVPIVELCFAEIDGTPGKFKALLDGEIQEKVFDSIEQLMIEYAIADNEAFGFYMQQELHDLVLPHKESLDMPAMKLQLSPPVQMDTFVNQFKPSTPPPLKDKEKGKSREINLVVKFTPEQFSEVEPRIESLKAKFKLENLTDLFMDMLQLAEESDVEIREEGETQA